MGHDGQILLQVQEIGQDLTLTLGKLLGAPLLQYLLRKPVSLEGTLGDLALGHEVFRVSLNLALFAPLVEYRHHLYDLVVAAGFGKPTVSVSRV